MKWLDRTLVTSPYYFGLCRTEKDFKRELKRLNVPQDQRPEFMASGTANATTHFFERGDGGLCAIVCMGSTKGRTQIEVHGLLVHEAVHIWQEVRTNIGEKSPSSEFEAYAVQHIAQALMEAWDES